MNRRKCQNNEWCSSLFRSVSLSDKFRFKRIETMRDQTCFVHIYCIIVAWFLFFSLKKNVWLFIVVCIWPIIYYHPVNGYTSGSFWEANSSEIEYFLWIGCMYGKHNSPRMVLWPKFSRTYSHGILHTIPKAHNYFIHQLKLTESDE